MKELMFVYGTLKRGFRNHHLIKNSKFIGDGVIKGYAMYDLGSFPGIKKDENEEVKGEVFEIDQNTLKRVDQLESEGYLYIRTRADVHLEGEIIKAATYVYNRGVINAPKVGKEWRHKVYD